ncbi:MAG TPA: tetratricopeptide repeat-containing diguanylate cyclase [Longimicrobium sp.]|nr:tetratricopeptide repeat-containing diguanylate cyclase [Longimicrobium sp.]
MTIGSKRTETVDDAVAALCARALALRHADPAAALAIAEEAVEAAASAGARRRSLAALGACLAVFPGEVLRAREILHQALHECAGAGDDALRCEVLCALGDAYAATSEWEAATQHLQEAVELSRRLGRGRDEARALRLQGSVFSSTGDFVQALPLLLQALELHESSGDTDGAGADVAGAAWERGTLFRQIAIVYSNMDQFQQAVSYYEVALDCFRDHHPLLAARTLYSMGVTTEEMGDPADAEACYQRSLELYERHGDAVGCALSRRGLASLLIRRREYGQAEGIMHEVLALLEGNPMHLGAYADALWGMADIQTGKSLHASALEYLERALPIFLQAERPAAHLAELHRRLSGAYKTLGRFQEALQHHERFHELRLEHLEAQANARMAQMMVQFDTERALKDREISRLRNVELEREIAERKEAEAALARAKAELEEANRELHALTIRDPLTGLFNRRHLDQRFGEAFALARRHAQPLSVMICDVDDFKRINDTFSHATGDQVLRAVAGIIRQHVRVSDVAARFGGEEFVVLFPAATLEQAAAASEKLRELVAGFPWSTLHPDLAVTISAGVAAAEAQENHEKLLIEADSKLYEAKRLGKNRVVS